MFFPFAKTEPCTGFWSLISPPTPLPLNNKVILSCPSLKITRKLPQEGRSQVLFCTLLGVGTLPLIIPRTRLAHHTALMVYHQVHGWVYVALSGAIAFCGGCICYQVGYFPFF